MEPLVRWRFFLALGLVSSHLDVSHWEMHGGDRMECWFVCWLTVQFGVEFILVGSTPYSVRRIRSDVRVEF